MDSYFNLINRELITIIVSYLPIYDVRKWIFGQISNIDYNIIFKLKFPTLYHNNINKYNIEDIYLDLLRVSEEYSIFKTIIKTLNPNKVDILDKMFTYGYTKDKVFINQTLKYLNENGHINMTINLISLMDDVEVFKSYINKYIKDDDLELSDFSYFMDNNSHNILEYIFTDESIKPYVDTIILSLKDYLTEEYTNYYMDIETTKLLIKNLALNNDDFIDILEEYYYDAEEDQFDTFYYILDLVDIKTQINKIINLITILFDKINNYERIRSVYNKFYNLFSRDDILKLYKNIVTVISNYNLKYDQVNDDIIKSLTLISRDKRLDNLI